jgi:hypothetical protein
MSATGPNRAVLVAIMSLMSPGVCCKNVADILLFRRCYSAVFSLLLVAGLGGI